MIQTQLIKAATQATPADSGITLPGLTQEGAEPLQGTARLPLPMPWPWRSWSTRAPSPLP